MKERDAEALRETFADRLRSDVTLVFFTQEHECMYCRETRHFLEELAALSEKLHLETTADIIRYALDRGLVD